MPFEFFLDPVGAASFDTDQLEAMDAHLRALPTVWPFEPFDDSYTVFASEDERARGSAELRAKDPDVNDYRFAMVALSPTEILLSMVGDLASNRTIYEFVRWCLARWPCALFEYDTPVEPEILLEAGC